MVRVSFFIVMSTVLLASCATEQPTAELPAQDLLDCVPKPTLIEVLSCASAKQGAAAAAHAPETKAAGQGAS